MGGWALKIEPAGAITRNGLCSPLFDGSRSSVVRRLSARRHAAIVIGSVELKGPGCWGADPVVSTIISSPLMVTTHRSGTGSSPMPLSSSQSDAG